MKKVISICFLFMVTVPLFSQNREQVMDYRDCFFAFIKGTNLSITDQLIEQYINDFHQDFYIKSRRNEFEWREGVKKYREEFDQGLISYGNNNVVYIALTSIEINNYDFDKNGFPVTIKETTFLSLRSTELTYKQLNDVGLYFPNLSKYNFVAISADKASDFIKSRTNQNTGYVDRKVTLRIYFKIAPFNTSEYKSIANSMGSRYYTVLGIIDHIEAFDNTTKLGDLVSN